MVNAVFLLCGDVDASNSDGFTTVDFEVGGRMAKRERKSPRSRDARESVDEQTQPVPSSAGSDNSRIRERAYELYLERGDGSGDDMTDWLRAERELRSRDGEEV
jgi:hypothetical protein